MRAYRGVRGVIAYIFLASLLSGIPYALDAAENSLSVTVTPPLFQLTIGPGESWTSTLKVVNNNSYDVTYFASPMDFEAEGEQGKGRFLPLIGEVGTSSREGYTLGHWIEISPDPITIRKGSSGEIPFTVRVPQSAAPGGHYAAILVGTKPPEEAVTGPSMKISSFVSSLLFVRIKGDVIEGGRVREFRSKKTLYETPKADFLLRFENTGNTHLRPQGDITIYNMWGKERGAVNINQVNNFGNVLPKSIRKFEFSWEGERSTFDIGRYSAVVTLSYGQDNKQTVSATNYFWVVPIIPVALSLGSLVAFLLIMMWLIRRYIRRALALEKARYAIPEYATTAPEPLSAMQAFIEPLKEGVVDLRNVGRAQTPRAIQAVSPTTVSMHSDPLKRDSYDAPLTLFAFFQKYSLFFFFLALLGAGGMGIWMYFDNVLQGERTFEITDVSIAEEEGGNTEE